MKLSDELVWRGQIKDKTFPSASWLDKPGTFYLGVDVGSSDSLTIGNLAIYMLARRLIHAGWKPVLLMGGATSLIGDPGGKADERDLVSFEQVEDNKKGIQAQVKQLFASESATYVDNYDWFKDIGYLEFLRDAGKHFSMTELLQRDYITERIGKDGSGISYAEFSYSLIQGYDYFHLAQKHDVTLQIGGSDQWGNMLSGVPLVRKKLNKEVHAMSIPLVVDKTTGVKFGKSEEGAVWLDQKKTSVYKFYQFWLNVDDESVIDFLKIYTELDKHQVEQTLRDFNQNRGGRLAQKTLAYEVTKLVHGVDRADSVKRVTEVLFGKGDYTQLSAADFNELGSELATANAKTGQAVLELLVITGLASSNTEARQFLRSGGVYINGEQVKDEAAVMSKEHSLHGYAVLRRGKNTQALLKVS